MRVEDRDLLDTYHNKKCLACDSRPCDPAHIRTVARGGPDTTWNVVPLCRKHHTEQHKLGWDRMRRKYPQLHIELILQGWTKENGRLWHPGLEGLNEDQEM